MTTNQSNFDDFVHICPLEELRFELKNLVSLTPMTYKSIDKSYFDNLKEEQFKQSTVGHKGSDIVDLSVRASKYMKTECSIKRPQEYYFDRSLNPKEIKVLRHSLECKVDNSWTLLKYNTNDHFNIYHYDTFHNDKIATILLFPPQSYYGSYIGGDLVFKNNDQEYRVETSKFPDKMMCVIFGKVLHKCEPITDGIRYVFKSTISATIPDILSHNIRFTTKMLDGYESESFNNKRKKKIIEKELLMTKLKELIKQYHEQKCNYVLQNLPSKLNLKSTEPSLISQETEYSNILIQIENIDNALMDYSDHYFYLDKNKYNLCALDYYIDDMKDINQYKKSTIDYIRKLISEGWNIAYLYCTYNYTTDYEENETKLTHIDLFEIDDLYDSNYKLCSNYNRVKNGKCLDKHSEYNDYSGNDIYEEYQCSCLFIWQ